MRAARVEAAIILAWQFVAFNVCETADVFAATTANVSSPDPRCAEVEREWRFEEKARVLFARTQLKSNLKKLQSDVTSQDLISIIGELGQAADARAVGPLSEFLKNEANSAESRASAIFALDKIATSPARAANAQEAVLRVAIPALERVLRGKDVALRVTAAEFLYRAGRKKIAGPVLLAGFHAGNLAGFNALLIVRQEDSIVAGTTYNPCVKVRIDPDAITLLMEAGDAASPGNVRLAAARDLHKAGETEKALSILRRTMVEAKDFNSRIDAMNHAANIGTDEAWEIVEQAAGLPELKNAAESRLRGRSRAK